MNPYALIVGIVVVSVFADYLLKLASQRSNWLTTFEFAAGALLYAITAAGWVLAMRQMSLASIAVSYSVLTILLLAALGVVMFREVLTGRDLLGVAFAIAALSLMSRSH